MVPPVQRAGGEPALAPHAVLLYAEWVDGEEERPAPVVEGVEVDRDPVVGVEVVAIGDGRADATRLLVVRDDAEVDRVRRVPDQHLGALLGRPAVDRLVLVEAIEDGRLPPDRLVQLAVHLDRGFNARHVGGVRRDSSVLRCLAQQQEKRYVHGADNLTPHGRAGTSGRGRMGGWADSRIE